jgi:hypothetical protein
MTRVRRLCLRRSWIWPGIWLLLLVLGVGWLALVAGRESDRARRNAELLERDYASFVADRLSDASAERYRRFVGLSGLDTSRERPSALALLIKHAHDRHAYQLPAPNQPEVRYLFAYDAGERRLRTSGPVPAQELRALRTRLAHLPRGCAPNRIFPFGRLSLFVGRRSHSPAGP